MSESVRNATQRIDAAAPEGSDDDASEEEDASREAVRRAFEALDDHADSLNSVTEQLAHVEEWLVEQHTRSRTTVAPTRAAAARA